MLNRNTARRWLEIGLIDTRPVLRTHREEARVGLRRT